MFRQGAYRKRFVASFAVLMAASVCFSRGTARADQAKLLRMTPDGANVLVIADAKRLFASPLAVKEEWAKERAADFRGGMTAFPPETTAVVIASRFNPANASEGWEVGLIELSKNVSMDKLANREGGSTDTVAGKTVVYSPRNILFAQLDDNTVAMMMPANRQDLGRWLRITSQKGGGLSPYLQQAAEIGQDEAQVAIAIDLQDLLVPTRVRPSLERARSLQSMRVDLDALTKLIVGLRGVTFAVQVTDQMIGKIQVDFEGDPSILGAAAKPLLLEALSLQGVLIDEFNDWQVKIGAKSVSLYGALSRAGLRKISSLVLAPSSSFGAPQEEPVQSEGEKQITATQKYYKTLRRMLDDLREQKGPTQGYNAQYHERYALKIDRLPLKDVDPDLLAAGSQIADLLREISIDLRQVGIQTGAKTAGMAGTVYYGDGGYGYGYGGRSWTRANPQIAAIKGQERAKGVSSRFEKWQDIDNIMADTRKMLVQKYNVEF